MRRYLSIFPSFFTVVVLGSICLNGVQNSAPDNLANKESKRKERKPGVKGSKAKQKPSTRKSEQGGSKREGVSRKGRAKKESKLGVKKSKAKQKPSTQKSEQGGSKREEVSRKEPAKKESKPTRRAQQKKEKKIKVRAKAKKKPLKKKGGSSKKKNRTKKKKEASKKRKRSTTGRSKKKKRARQKKEAKKKSVYLPDYFDAVAQEVIAGSEFPAFTHHLNENFKATIAGRMTSSLRKSSPALDKQSRSSLFFNGENPKFNLYNSFCKELRLPTVGLAHLIASLHLGCVNNDVARRSFLQERIVALRKSSKQLHRLRSSFEKLEENSMDMLLFFITKKGYHKFMNDLKAFLYPHTIWPNHFKELEMLFTGKKKSVVAEGLEKIDVSVVRILNIEIKVLETLSQMHRQLTTTKQLINTLFLYPYNLISKKSGIWSSVNYFTVDPNQDSDQHQYQGMGAVLASTMWNLLFSLPYSLKQHLEEIYERGASYQNIFAIIKLPFSVLFGVHQPELLANHRKTKMCADVLNIIFYNVLGFINDTGFIYENIKGLINLYKQFKEVTTQAQKTISAMNMYRKTILKTLRILEKDAVLKELFKEDIKLFKTFLKTKFCKVLKTGAKDCRKPITMGEIVNFLNRKSFRILKCYRHAAKLSEEADDLIKNAFVALHELEILLAIGYKLRLSEEDITDRKICIPTQAEESDRAVLEYKDSYNIRIPKNIVKNDFKSKGRYQNGQMIMGGNGGGKTVALEGTVAGIVFHQSYGWFPSQAARLSSFGTIHFSRNIADDTSKGLSLMMKEIKNLFDATKKIIGEDKPILIGIDEPNKGTPQAEGAALLVSVLKKILQQNPKNFAIVTTHFTDLPKIAKRLNYKGFDFYTTEFKKGKGFTFKIIPGLPYTPACVHLVEDQSFHPEIFKDFIYLLKSNPNYRSELKAQLPTSEHDTLYGFFKWFFVFLLLMAVAFVLVIRKHQRRELGEFLRALKGYIQRLIKKIRGKGRRS